jgi:acetolactate synthase-1/2/3 large subunit
MFGLPGGGPNLDVVGAAAAVGLRFVLTHTESAAAIMAATCADLTGAPGALVVTRGPGLASAVNGIAHAALDRLPVIVIADTVRSAEADRISHQRLDQAALGGSVAKAVVTISGSRGGDAAADAVRLALAPPAGPVIALMDDSASPDGGSASPAQIAAADPGQDTRALDPAGAAAGHDLAALAQALRAARRPVVMLGADAIPYTAPVRAALHGSGIPVLHTYRARGIVPDSAAEAAGLVTGGTMEWPLLAAADLIVGLGVDEAEMIPAPWDYPGRTILVTEYPAERGKAAYFTGASQLTGPLPEAIEILAGGGGHDWPPGVGRAIRMRTAMRLAEAACAAPGRLAPQHVAATARAHMPHDCVATVDAGAHMLAVMPLWEVAEPRRLLISSGLATMGFALPAAIAAALCAPGRPVVAFTGDGGLGMTLAEIETAVRLVLRIVIVVFNDAALSLIKIKQRPGQGGGEAVDYGPVSFAGAAGSMGAAAAAVRSEAELAAALAAALRRDGPTVIDARVDPAGYPLIMDLSRGDAGRQPVPGLSPSARPE